MEHKKDQRTEKKINRTLWETTTGKPKVKTKYYRNLLLKKSEENSILTEESSIYKIPDRWVDRWVDIYIDG